MKKRIIVFASGSGSNAEKIFDYFSNSHTVEVVGLVYNRENAGVIERAEKYGVQSYYFPNDAFDQGKEVLELCLNLGVEYIILAGFLRKIPNTLLQTYKEKIINIHPSLLPKYGGKGMYGHFVHEKVSASGDNISGITIHLVDEIYDNGKIIAQQKCEIVPFEPAEKIAQKVLTLEHQFYAPTIENYIL